MSFSKIAPPFFLSRDTGYLAIILIAFTGCGSGSDNTSEAADAAPIDAAPALTGLGQACDPDVQDSCPMEVSICAFLAQGDPGFCTTSCGTTAEPPMGQLPTPPTDANSQTICDNAYTFSTGTPMCALTFQAQGGQIPWGCGVRCGAFQNVNLGDCPPSLTCVDNLCTP